MANILTIHVPSLCGVYSLPVRVYNNHFTTIGALFMCLIVGKVPIQIVYRHHFAGYLIF